MKKSTEQKIKRPVTVYGNSVQAKRLYDVIVKPGSKRAVGMYRPDMNCDSCVMLIYWAGGVGYAAPRDIEFIRLNKNETVL